MQIEANQLYTPREAAEYLRKTEASLATGRCRKDFPLPWVKVGHKIAYLGSDIINFLARNRVEVPNDDGQ